MLAGFVQFETVRNSGTTSFIRPDRFETRGSHAGPRVGERAYLHERDGSTDTRSGLPKLADPKRLLSIRVATSVLAAWKARARGGQGVAAFAKRSQRSTRVPAMKKARIDVRKLTGGTGRALDDLLPGKVQWIAHNYNHLHEAPTVFYAVALSLAMIGQGDGLNAMLGWAYVGLRIVHSLVQALWNRITVRFLLFVLSSLVLIMLVVHLLLAVFGR